MRRRATETAARRLASGGKKPPSDDASTFGPRRHDGEGQTAPPCRSLTESIRQSSLRTGREKHRHTGQRDEKGGTDGDEMSTGPRVEERERGGWEGEGAEEPVIHIKARPFVAAVLHCENSVRQQMLPEGIQRSVFPL